MTDDSWRINRRLVHVQKTWLVVVSSLLFYVGSRAKADSRSDAAQQLAKAADLGDLRAADNQPFELTASLTATDNAGHSFPGTYQLRWASANQWRETIVLPGYTRTLIGGEGKEWRQRSIKFELPQVWILDQALGFPGRLRDFAPKVSAKLKAKKMNQVDMECAHLKQDFREEDLCFDPTTGALTRENLPLGAAGGEESVRTMEYSDFIHFGSKMFPSSIKIMGQQDKPIVIFSNAKLIPLPQEPATEFAAPAGAEEWVTCGQPERPKITKQTPPAYPTDAKLNHEQGTVVFYALVETDGLVHNLTLIESASPRLDKAAFQAVSQWQYEPRKCGGVAAPTETFIDVVFALN